MKFRLISLAYFIAVPVIILAQDIPVLRKVKVDVAIDQLAPESYSYSYSVTNGEQNTAFVWIFEVDISAPSPDQPIDTSGLMFLDDFTRRTTLKAFQTARTGIVGIGFLSRPRHWTAGITIDGKTADWGTGSHFIKPGDNQPGFTLQSKGLPSPRRFGAHGYLDIEQFPSLDDVSELQADSIRQLIDSLRATLIFVDNTIGPQIPPIPFDPMRFLDTLISYKHQAFTLGWITNKGILNSLDQKLDNARKQLKRGNNKAAKNILEAFVNEVEAQKEKHLSSEAYALLKFNAEYVISKLQ